MTVAQYWALHHREDLQQELHGGQLVTVTCLGVVEMEVAFRAPPMSPLFRNNVGTVMRPGQAGISYHVGSSLPLALFGAQQLRVASIFP